MGGGGFFPREDNDDNERRGQKDDQYESKAILNTADAQNYINYQVTRRAEIEIERIKKRRDIFAWAYGLTIIATYPLQWFMPSVSPLVSLFRPALYYIFSAQRYEAQQISELNSLLGKNPIIAVDGQIIGSKHRSKVYEKYMKLSMEDKINPGVVGLDQAYLESIKDNNQREAPKKDKLPSPGWPRMMGMGSFLIESSPLPTDSHGGMIVDMAVNTIFSGLLMPYGKKAIKEILPLERYAIEARVMYAYEARKEKEEKKEQKSPLAVVTPATQLDYLADLDKKLKENIEDWRRFYGHQKYLTLEIVAERLEAEKNKTVFVPDNSLQFGINSLPVIDKDELFVHVEDAVKNNKEIDLLQALTHENAYDILSPQDGKQEEVGLGTKLKNYLSGLKIKF